MIDTRMSSKFNTLGRFVIPVVLVCCCLAFAGVAQGQFPAGTYSSQQVTITFNADGSHAVTFDGKVVAKGSYTTSGDTVVMTDKEGDYPCEKPGTYKWSSMNGEIRFERVTDECEGRVAALTAGAWKKS